MEGVLKNLQERTEDKVKLQNIFHILKVYVNNIVENPTNIKYRKIRKSNPKFHSIIWSNEDARSFLLLAGFEESDDFLVLPEGVYLDEVKAILDTVSSDNAQANADNNSKPTTSLQQPSSSNRLTLRGSTADSSMFEETLKADMTLLSYMKEMGFDVAVAEKALIITKNQGIQPAMDWINSNPGKVTEIQMAQFRQPSMASETVAQTTATGPPTTGDNDHAHSVAKTSEAGPVSRYQTTIDERHRFQERVRLEAIEAARLEKAELKRQKQYLLKNLEDEKKERQEKGERIKSMRMQDGSATTPGTGSQEIGKSEDDDRLSLRIRLPDGQITNLKLPSHSRLEEIYKHISSISHLKEEEFVVMKVAPQSKLTEKEKTLDDLGLKSQEALIVQRVDQAGSLTQGHGTFRQVLEITSVIQWENIQWQNKDQLIVVECYVSGSPDRNSSVEEFEALNSKYGIEKQALFVRINFELQPAFKEMYHVDVFPSYKLFWNNEALSGISGMDKDKLEKVIVENLRGPVAERVADRESDEYFDPR